jgi:hypothetical protein
MTYTIYSQATGQILRIVQTNDIESQLQDGESYLEGSIDDSDYYIENGSAVKIPPQPDQYSIFDFVTKQWVENENLAIAFVLPKRQRLLYASDWTQIPNNPLTVEQQLAWETYRQELRNITTQPGYPFNVIWPTPPQG